jgi:hypothetical protein
MTAQQQQVECVVVLIVPFICTGHHAARLEHPVPLLPTRSSDVAAHRVDESPLGNGQQPAEWPLRHLAPHEVRLEERLLHGILAAAEVAMAADEHTQHAWSLLTQLALDREVRTHRCSPLISGHSSIAQPSGPSPG